MAETSTSVGPSSLKTWRPRRRWALIVAGPVVILLVAAYLYLTSGRVQETDNAYVQIAKTPVSATIPGRVSAVYVRENQLVRAGTPLFQLDVKTYQATHDYARAQLAQATVEVSALRSRYEQQQARATAAQERMNYTTREAARQQAMAAAGVSSRQQADAAAQAVRVASEELTIAREELRHLKEELSLGTEHPKILAARAELAHADIGVGSTLVRAPADGIVTRVVQLQPGAYINASQTLFWLLTGKPWIEANFKEDQLGKMRVGQPVEIKVDAYTGEALSGHVTSFSPGTGAVFSAIPAQNATGNWVKVTQRLPVRIDFDRVPPEMASRAGLSARVKVDVRATGKAPSG